MKEKLLLIALGLVIFLMATWGGWALGASSREKAEDAGWCCVTAGSACVPQPSTEECKTVHGVVFDNFQRSCDITCRQLPTPTAR